MYFPLTRESKASLSLYSFANLQVPRVHERNCRFVFVLCTPWTSLGLRVYCIKVSQYMRNHRGIIRHLGSILILIKFALFELLSFPTWSTCIVALTISSRSWGSHASHYFITPSCKRKIYNLTPGIHHLKPNDDFKITTNFYFGIIERIRCTTLRNNFIT